MSAVEMKSRNEGDSSGVGLLNSQGMQFQEHREVSMPSLGRRASYKSVSEKESQSWTTCLFQGIYNFFVRDSFAVWLAILLGIATAILYGVQKSGGSILVDGYALYLWGAALLIIIAFYFIARFIEFTVFWIIERLSFTPLWPVWFFISNLKGYIAILVTLIVSSVLWGVVDLPFYTTEYEVLRNIWSAILLVDIMFILRQVAINVVFWKVSSKAFVDKSKEVQFNEFIIKRLSQKIPERERRSSGARRLSLDSTGNLPRPHIGTMKQHPTMIFKQMDDVRHESFGWSTGLRKSKHDYTNFQTVQQAEHFADGLFRHIDVLGKGFLDLEDISRFFKPQTAPEVFLLIAQGENSELDQAVLEEDINSIRITPSTFKKAVLRMRSTRLSFSNDIQSSSSVSSILTAFLQVISWILAPMIFAIVMGVSFNSVILTFSSILISFSFALGSSISRLVESAYFLFITKPFAVGDRIVLGGPEGEIYIVLELSLMSTAVRTLTNKYVTLPNHELAKQVITNFNRLPSSTVPLDFIVSMSTSSEAIHALEESIKAYLRKYKEDWKPKTFVMFYVSIEECNALKISFWQDSRHRWQDGLSLFTARSKLLAYIKCEILRLGIEFHQVPQRVLVTNQSRKDS